MTTPFIKVIKNELVTGVSISLISVVVGPSLQLGLMSGEVVTQLGWFGYDGPQINSHQVIDPQTLVSIGVTCRASLTAGSHSQSLFLFGRSGMVPENLQL